MNKRAYSFLTMFVLFSFLLSGCYYFSAKREMQNAERLISELKAGGGEKLVPYEYTSAEKFLEVSKIEFKENDFKSASIPVILMIKRNSRVGLQMLSLLSLRT
jgi:hypothetical protein